MASEKDKELKDFIGKLDGAMDVIAAFGNKLSDAMAGIDPEEVADFLEDLQHSKPKKETKKERAARKEKAVAWLKERYPKMSAMFDELQGLCDAVSFRVEDIEESRQLIADKLESIGELEDEIENLKEDLGL